MLKNLSIILAFLFITISFFLNPISVTASISDLKTNSKPKHKISSIIEKTTKFDPQKPISQKLNKNPKDTNELNSDQKDLKIKFNLKNKKQN